MALLIYKPSLVHANVTPYGRAHCDALTVYTRKTGALAKYQIMLLLCSMIPHHKPGCYLNFFFFFL